MLAARRRRHRPRRRPPSLAPLNPPLHRRIPQNPAEEYLTLPAGWQLLENSAIPSAGPACGQLGAIYRKTFL